MITGNDILREIRNLRGKMQMIWICAVFTPAICLLAGAFVAFGLPVNNRPPSAEIRFAFFTISILLMVIPGILYNLKLRRREKSYIGKLKLWEILHPDQADDIEWMRMV